MGVDFSILGGVVETTTPIPTFTDSLQVAGFYVRWRAAFTGASVRNAALIHPQVVESVINGVSIGGVPTALNMTCGGAAGISTQVRAWFTPTIWGEDFIGVFGTSRAKNQFSEVTVISDDAAGVQLNHYGPGVLAFPGTGQNGYYIEVQANVGHIALYSGIGFAGVSGNTLLIPGGGTMLFANNDVLRLEVVLNAGTNDLTVLRNGVIVGTFSDNNGARPLVGMPGLAYVFQSDNVITGRLQNFSGGPL